MSKILKALMTQLNWQSNEFKTQLDLIATETQAIKTQIEKIKLNLNQSSWVSPHIHPELEINRLNFMTKEYEKKESLLLQLKEQSSLEDRVKEKLQEVKRQLKMLENYQQRAQLKKQRQQQQAQEKALDEWVIQNKVTT